MAELQENGIYMVNYLEKADDQVEAERTLMAELLQLHPTLTLYKVDLVEAEQGLILELKEPVELAKLYSQMLVELAV